jgi:hypothetical protein
MRSSGKTWRRILNALKEASNNRTVLFISASSPHLDRAIDLAICIVKASLPARRWKYSITQKRLMITNAGCIQFMLHDGSMYERIAGYGHTVSVTYDEN